MAAPLTQFQQALDWIGFTVDNQRNAIEQELGDFKSMKDLSYKDIRDLRDGYAKRTVAEGRIHFGMTRTKRLKALIDWVRDLDRVGEEQPDINAHPDRDSFLDAINDSADRAAIRAADEETMESRAKDAAPGPLTGEGVWEKWETKLVNMLSILIGVNGIPLIYVIQENANAVPNAVYDTFVEECITRCPLQGPKYEADARKVHQIIASYTTGETAEQWLKRHVKKANGRVDMQALRDYYRGEGNQTRSVTDAEKLRDTLHYKSEGAMPFATFLSKCQKMYIIFSPLKQLPLQLLHDCRRRYLMHDPVQSHIPRLSIKDN